MKKNFAFFAFLIFALSILASVSFFCVGEASAENPVVAVSWYDATRKPEFYGATEIILDKNAVNEFNVKDSRFRIFAKDFEDGDLTNAVECVFNNVDTKTAGYYSVEYEVTDSHGNTQNITVPVRVTDNSDGKITVVRTVYSVARLSHLKNVGVERCDNGDRQSLGVFLSSDSEIQITVLDSDVDLTITCFTNTRAQNSFVTLKKDADTPQSVKNVKTGVSYACVPLISSPRLTEDGYPDKTYKISVQYDSSVKPLDHYHYGDDETSFKNEWKQSQNEFGLIDGEAVLFVVPFADVDKIDGSFETVDEMLDYFLKVVDKYDSMIGLTLNPTRPSDQNFRTKYTAVADYAMKGIGAYYESSFIAVCAESVSALFQYGWGTLHEIAHGYQGLLGRGNAKNESLYLNETGNNILAHYVQIDKEIYKADHDWMGGPKEKIEETNNRKRLNGESIFTNSNGTYTNVAEKLYCLVNLFDAFEGETTYAKLFSDYRYFVAQNGTGVYTIADFYALFFAKEYCANILPYLTAWTITVSDSVQKSIYSRNLETYSITASALSPESLEKLKEKEGVTLNYGLISNSTVKKYSEKANLTVKLEIDDFEKIKNKSAFICSGDVYDPKNAVNKTKIDDIIIAFDDLSAGSYMLRLPSVTGYDSSVCSVTLVSGDNEIVYRYRKHEGNDYLQTRLSILGIYGTVGFALTLDDDNTSATITLGGADLGNRNATWAAQPDTTFASVSVSDESGNALYSWEVKGNSYFSDLTNDNLNIELKYGYKIKLYTYRPQGVAVFLVDKNKNTRIREYDTTANETEYVVTKNGLKLVNGNFDEKETLYEYAKANYLEFIENYKNHVQNRIDSENVDETKDVSENLLVKNQVIAAYDNLKDDDKSEDITAFIQAIKRGGSPEILTLNELITVRKGDMLFDLSSKIKVIDAEDVFVENVIVDKFVPDKAGKHSVKVTATDSDGNQTIAFVTVSVIENAPIERPCESPQVKVQLDPSSITVIVILCVIGLAGITLGVTFIVIKNKKIKNKRNE